MRQSRLINEERCLKFSTPPSLIDGFILETFSNKLIFMNPAVLLAENWLLKNLVEIKLLMFHKIYSIYGNESSN